MNSNRYIRQTLLSEIGELGQKRLSEAHIVIIGCGGLGSIAAPYLAGAGIGKLSLVDGDAPSLSNLHRQVFFETKEYKETKSEVLANHIRKLNPEIELSIIPEMVSKNNIESILQKVDLVLECTDNIQTKYLVNDFAHLLKIPLVYGAIYKYDGYVAFFENQTVESIHLRDIFPVPNDDIPTCSEVGVLGTLAGMIGLLQANEAIKYIARVGTTLKGKMLTYNVLTNEQLKLSLKKTFTESMEVLYSKSSYKAKSICTTIPEYSVEEVRHSRNRFDLVSILDSYEHLAFDEDVSRIPLSEIDPLTWKPTSDKTTLFYCLSGKRSAALVHMILEVNPSANIASLQGGIQAAAQDLVK